MSDAAAEPVSLARLFRPQSAATAAPPAAPAAIDPAALDDAWQQGHAAASAELGATIELLQQGLATAERQRITDDEAARALAHQLAAALEARFARELATLALAASEAILQTEPTLATATLESLLLEATASLGGGTLFVAPDLLDRATALAPPGWTVQARDGLSPQTVEAEAGATLQRASLTARLQQLLEQRP